MKLLTLIVWLGSIAIYLASDTLELHDHITIAIPAAFLLLSFILVEQFKAMFRWFHHLIVIQILVWYLYSMYLHMPRMEGNLIEQYLSYSQIYLTANWYIGFMLFFGLISIPHSKKIKQAMLHPTIECAVPEESLGKK